MGQPPTGGHPLLAVCVRADMCVLPMQTNHSLFRVSPPNLAPRPLHRSAPRSTCRSTPPPRSTCRSASTPTALPHVCTTSRRCALPSSPCPTSVAHPFLAPIAARPHLWQWESTTSCSITCSCQQPSTIFLRETTGKESHAQLVTRMRPMVCNSPASLPVLRHVFAAELQRSFASPSCGAVSVHPHCGNGNQQLHA